MFHFWCVHFYTSQPFDVYPCFFFFPEQERLARIEQDIREEEQRQRAEAKAKREQIDRAEKNKLAPVDDSQMVDEMFGFIDAQTDSSGEGAAPTAFKVLNILYHLPVVPVISCYLC